MKINISLSNNAIIYCVEILNDYFDRAFPNWTNKVSDPELANLLALIEAQSNNNIEQTIKYFKYQAIRRISPELLVTAPPAAIIEIKDVLKSGHISAGSLINIIDKNLEYHKFSLMFDEDLVKAEISTEFMHGKLIINLNLKEIKEKITIYIQNNKLMNILLCNNYEISGNYNYKPRLTHRTRKEFLPNRLNPYFLIYQHSLLPMQVNFFNLEFGTILKPGKYIFEIECNIETKCIMDAVKINCLPVIGLFEENSGYTDNTISSKTDIFDIIQATEYLKELGHEKNISNDKIYIEKNIVKIKSNNLVSAKMLCIANCKTAYSMKSDYGNGETIIFNCGHDNYMPEFEDFINLFEETIFNISSLNSQNLINRINQLYGMPTIDVNIEITGGPKKHAHWKSACPKYLVIIKSEDSVAIPWAYTFQKLCDINRICDVNIKTQKGSFIIEDQQEW